MQFSYIAKNLKGEEESGTIEVQDKDHLARLLRQKGYFLVSFNGKDVGEKKLKLPQLRFFHRLFGVSLTDRLFFTRNLEIMIKTGMPLTRAFDVLSLQSKSKSFGAILHEVGQRIIKGDSLSSALAQHPDVFSALYQETIKVGEETGKLDESLRILAQQMEKEYNLKSKVKTAMVYPVVVLTLTIVVGVLMMIFAVPKLKQTFTELNVPLPLTTQIVLGTADFMVNQWPIALFIALVLLFFGFVVITSAKFKRPKSWLVLHLPLVASLSRKLNSALMLRTLSSLFKSGVPILRALHITSGSLSNYYFKKSLDEAAVKVEKGGKLAEALKPYEDLYTMGVLQMMEVGEETGETSEVLKKLAEFYEEEVSSSTERLSAVIEPFLILFIGGIVGLFVVSMMQPMFSIMNNIR